MCKAVFSPPHTTSSPRLRVHSLECILAQLCVGNKVPMHVVGTYLKPQIQKWKQHSLLWLQRNLIFILHFPFCVGAENAATAMLCFPCPLLLEEPLWFGSENNGAGGQCWWGLPWFIVITVAPLLSHTLFLLDLLLSHLLCLPSHPHFRIVSHWSLWLYASHIHLLLACPWLSGHQAAPQATLGSVGGVLGGPLCLPSWMPENTGLVGITVQNETEDNFSEPPKTDLGILPPAIPGAGLGPGSRDSIPFQAPTGLCYSSLSCHLFLPEHFSLFMASKVFSQINYLGQWFPKWVTQLIPWCVKENY